VDLHTILLHVISASENEIVSYMVGNAITNAKVRGPGSLWRKWGAWGGRPLLRSLDPVYTRTTRDGGVLGLYWLTASVGVCACSLVYTVDGQNLFCSTSDCVVHVWSKASAAGRRKLFKFVSYVWCVRQLLLLYPSNRLFSRTTWVSRSQKGETSLDLNVIRDDEVWG